jgi:hypothetical protein
MTVLRDTPPMKLMGSANSVFKFSARIKQIEYGCNGHRKMLISKCKMHTVAEKSRIGA